MFHTWEVDFARAKWCLKNHRVQGLEKIRSTCVATEAENTVRHRVT